MDGFSSIAKVWQAPALYLALALIIAFFLVTNFFAYFKVYRVVIRHQAQSHSQMQVMSAKQITPGCPSNISKDLPWPYFMCTVFSYFVTFPTLQHLPLVFSREKASVSIMQSLVHSFFSISPISISLPAAFSVRTSMVTDSFLMLIQSCERFVSHLKTRIN